MHPVLKNYLTARGEISAAHLELIDSLFIRKITKRNEILLPAGSIAKNSYFVISGCLRIFLTSTEGVESTRFLIFEGEMGTAFPSFILREPSAATIQSTEPSEILQLSYENRAFLMKHVPGWETTERLEIEKAYINSIRRIEGLITTDARERYRLLMLQHPEMIKRLPSRVIADYLGISPETLSRLKTKI